MAMTNQERVGKAMDLLRVGLAPFVEREVQSAVKAGTVRMDAVRRFAEDPMLGSKPIAQWDAAGLLKLMWETWNDVFKRTLGFAERSLVSELRDVRNKWAHQNPFSSDDADRALDSMGRLLAAVSAPQADEVGKMKMELRRLIFDEQVRGEKRKAGGSLIEPAAAGNLKSWREVVTPHADVASGRYQQAEFAADLWQVHLGEGSDEYRKPAEFFRRTFLTESLKRLLVGGVQRLSGQGGDPVVQLQTNFGGGKTHSMLALYHLFGGAAPGDLAGIDAVLAEAGVKTLPKARRVVLVGNKISPGNPVTKSDGTVVRTLWGELAYQLGGAKAFARIAKDDEKATSPGDVLRELFVEYGPCLVLVDEWVAYARQLHDQSDLPAGGFETQFTFAQALTESAKLAKNCLLVVSLPASDTAGSPHTQADDVEVGGIRGREALDRLRNVVGRVESSWRPATAEEGFEIVRRRLFEPIAGDMFKQRDLTARAFADLYQAQGAEFPPECRAGDYERRIQAAYPIHPEIFDRLYTDWSTLVKFQRTRGVLRLMAAVIHSLWEKGDRSPLILPSTVPIDDPRVQFELTRYLSDNWVPIIEKDVDGPNSLPLRIDGEVPNLGKVSATRRVARTIYLGSAPTAAAAHRGLEDRRVKLGCVMPGETPAVFGDALRRLASAATYLYQDGPRAWYATQPTVTKLAEDRAEQLKRDPDKVAAELEARLRADLKRAGDFSRIHPMPRSGADVPDDYDARLVVLPAEHGYTKESGNAAETAAKAILESRGNAPRLYRNTLVFLAADKVRLQDLDEALRKYLAWSPIVAEKEALNLDPHQTRQAETQKQAADGAVTARLPETYQWLLVPEQSTPQVPVVWQASRLTGSDALAVRASKKLRSDELLISSLGSTILRKHLDDVPLWRGDHVAVKQLVDDFARYLYLPRLAGPEVLVQAIRDGLALLTWRADTFGYAESYDEGASRYRGLHGGHGVSVSADSAGFLVKPDVASKQLDAETPPPEVPTPSVGPGGGEPGPRPGPGETPPAPPAAQQLRRFHGSVRVDSTRVGRDAGRIADEVIAHLAGQMGAEVTVTIEIEARLPNGATDQLVRTVTENSRTLKFDSQGFETE
ncbi:MAG: Swt1 family HEPN domain-containing protein [Defluviicoccus sp.]|nr:Swt1 family HEPN domain-containing protein [Defluviicoccus sp.]MDG4608395.1 Swt1 family HEPN domain-containing protein [Defluviicoccus sp.]